jgi:zinc transport system substrate-binding protein
MEPLPMKKILYTLILISTFGYAKLNIIASILPEQALIQSIGGEHVHVALMVKPGNSPHTYEPKPSQMKDIARASLYLAMGVEYEKVWLPKFANQNPKMQIIDLSEGIEKYPISGEANHHTKHLDPHIWTAPENLKKIAKHIYDVLSQTDSTHQAEYQKHYKSLILTIEETDKQLHQILDPLSKEQKRFIVFHPSWGYFARAYDLEQIPIEIAGKSPKPRAVQRLITRARKLGIQTILTSPEFSDAVAKQIANALKINVLKISPMEPKWNENLLKLAKTISNN